jgi:hypothetical protein
MTDKRGKWRKLYFAKLQNLYSLPNIVKVVKSMKVMQSGHVAPAKEIKNANRILIWEPQWNRQPGRSAKLK